MDYKLVLGDMTIHFCENYPMRKKPVIAVSFAGEVYMSKVASFNNKVAMRWFVECLSEALKEQDVRRFPNETNNG